MNPADQAIGYTANYTCVAFTLLVNCLKAQGVLGPTQFEDALQATLSAEGADRARLDYMFLKNLLVSLRRNEPGKPASKVSTELNIAVPQMDQIWTDFVSLERRHCR